MKDLGEVSDAFRATLSASVQTVCEGKPIRQTEQQEVDAASFIALSSNASVETEEADPKSNLPGCTDVKVSFESCGILSS